MRFLTACLLLILTCRGYSQTEKGGLTLGTSFLSVNYAEPLEPEHYSGHGFRLSVSPGIGKFVMNNFLIGISTNVSFSTNQFHVNRGDQTVYTKIDSKSNRNNYSIGPIVEYYFGKSTIGKPFLNLVPTMGIGSSSSYVTQSANYASYTSAGMGSHHNLNLSASGGYALFLKKSIMVKLLVGCNFQKNWMTLKTAGGPLDGTHNWYTAGTRFFFGVGISNSFLKRGN